MNSTLFIPKMCLDKRGALHISGILMMVYISFKSIKIQKSNMPNFIASGIVVNLLLWIGLSTDFYESLISLFILGFVFGLDTSKYSTNISTQDNL